MILNQPASRDARCPVSTVACIRSRIASNSPWKQKKCSTGATALAHKSLTSDMHSISASSFSRTRDCLELSRLNLRCWLQLRGTTPELVRELGKRRVSTTPLELVVLRSAFDNLCEFLKINEKTSKLTWPGRASKLWMLWSNELARR